MARDLDPGSSPAAFLGAELRRARVAAGMSQEQFSRSRGFDRTVITKAETGERPPSPEVAAAIDEAFPHLDGLFSRLTLLARRANGRYPEWFREWVDAEQRATALRTWQPILVPGLLQTRDYARALFQAWQPAVSSDDLDALVGARMERQAILDRADPPELLAVLDEAVEGITIDKPALVSKAAQAFERLRSEALPRGASRDLIRRVAEQRWTT